jgi:hypothetical protein
MIKVVPNATRLDDNWILNLRFEVSQPCEYGDVLIFPKTATVIAVKPGSIIDGQIRFRSRTFYASVSYPYNVDALDCAVTTYAGTRSKQQTVRVPIEHKSAIQGDLPKDAKNRIGATMKASLSLDTDIRVDLENARETWISFGEPSDYLLASDFAVKVYAAQKRLTIPIEVYWQKEHLLKGESLGIFELEDASKNALRNIFFKRRISNLLKRSEFPPKQSGDSVFCSPTGERILLGLVNCFKKPTEI